VAPVAWNFRAYESSFFRPGDGNLPLIPDVQVRGEVVVLTWDARAHVHTHAHLDLAFLIATRSGEEQILWAIPTHLIAIFRRSAVVGGGPGYTTGEKRRNCWNNGRAYSTARRTKRCGDYVTLKFNSAIVPRARRGRDPLGTLILFRKTATPPTNARRKESSGNSRANSSGVMQSVSCAFALCKSPWHFKMSGEGSYFIYYLPFVL